ncbi:MAG: aminotransferase class IV [Desulfobaccales bacterium]|jgi:branched-chain amino acid aminotransferase/para-aminobenzoate synthetase component 1
MDKPEFVWLDDDLVPLDQARVSVNDRGFQYGDGLFETIRAEAGRIFFLREHLTRLLASAKAFHLPFPGDLPWEARLNKLLSVNGLERGVARVKILLSRGAAAGLGLPGASRPTLVIWAQPYEPPPPAEYAAGWPVATFPERRTTFLGRHKSLNYLFYLVARQYALEQGAREALILEADGMLSEGAATSLLYLCRGVYCTPAAASALPGVTLAVLTLALARLGLLPEVVPTEPSRLCQAEGVWLANALLGLMPVASIDGQEIPVSAKTDFLREILRAEAWL